MAVLQLQINTGSSFLVRWLQRNVLDIAELSVMIAAKLHSPLVCCPRCPEGYHPQETICFSTQAADSTTLAIMVQLLEGRIVEPTYFAFLDVCAMAQYLLIVIDYLMPYLLPYRCPRLSCNIPTTLKGITAIRGWVSVPHQASLHCCIQYHTAIQATDYEKHLQNVSRFVSEDELLLGLASRLPNHFFLIRSNFSAINRLTNQSL